MSLFADLITELSSSTKTNDKLDSLAGYFASAPKKDRVWVIALFSGRRPKRVVNSTQLLTWCIEITQLPSWLFNESYHTVGDLGETIALLLPEPTEEDKSGKVNTSLSHFLEKFLEIEKQDEQIRKNYIQECWKYMSQNERFVFNKLITGGFRIGVSQKMMVNALAKTVDLPSSVIAHRISGNWDPVTTSFEELLSESASSVDHSKPYPFYLSYAFEDELEKLGDPAEWQAEWKWDGIRGQLVKRNGELFVWSRGEELMTEKFPEYLLLKDLLPNGVVLDGEIIPSREGQPLPFALLQTRIGRKNVTKKQLQEAPISFFAYDLLEWEGEDWRTRPLAERRAMLESIVNSISLAVIRLSPIIQFSTWEELTAARLTARDNYSEGIMLKRKSSTYQVGRKRGDWWKWKVEPLTIDAVMIYAQKGHGRRSNLYTDYTFAVKDGEKLLPFTKAYSGLTDKEMAQVDSFVKRNSLEKFGPVRTVVPELVFEIAFEGIAASSRHKSGVALRFPRILRWRKDKKPDEINTIDDLKEMLRMYGHAKEEN
ncbi:MAG: ATP-dependent DNA ligase [Williamsia sp.]|nr:ATP-dependent DNA ligase [Williamsia sp.]